MVSDHEGEFSPEIVTGSGEAEGFVETGELMKPMSDWWNRVRGGGTSNAASESTAAESAENPNQVKEMNHLRNELDMSVHMTEKRWGVGFGRHWCATTRRSTSSQTIPRRNRI
ncbi:unnamed protein product [Amoebophrya sp. A120]|nr:unnamed protein product [Amoebophrya sp. A120]|eukprot:GSA120T00007173001.1